ncbi:MAG TPA: hypothetical protein VN714_12915 [Trebonia sp.]|nr:hypothetical protein [Trebonia sp.]
MPRRPGRAFGANPAALLGAQPHHMIKRQMFGRGALPLPRKRVLLTARN